MSRFHIVTAVILVTHLILPRFAQAQLLWVPVGDGAHTAPGDILRGEGKMLEGSGAYLRGLGEYQTGAGRYYHFSLNHGLDYVVGLFAKKVGQ